MLDIKLVRTNPELVKENIKKKFQDEKLALVDEVLDLDAKFRASKARGDELRQQRNAVSKEIGRLMKEGKKDEAEETKKKVADIAEELAEMERREGEMTDEIKKRMMVLPNIIDKSVPIGRDDSENVEIERFGEPLVPDFEVPYHTDIMERLKGIDLDSARRTSGNGFYYLMGDIARLHEAIMAFARDFMIDKGFTYCIPPFMIRSEVVTGVMSFAEMENMMYKIEGEDLYLIGTSEHSMIGKYAGNLLTEEQLPQTMTSYSPCFRKEVGAHGIEERGVYRIHQFEKQEMIVVVIVLDLLQRNFQPVLASFHTRHLYLSASHIYAGRQQVQVFVLGMADSFTGRLAAYHHLVYCYRALAFVNSQAAGGVPLWVGVYQQHLFVHTSKNRG